VAAREEAEEKARIAAFRASLGGAVHVEPMKPMLKAPGIKRLKLKYDWPLSKIAFNFNLRRYTSTPRRCSSWWRTR